MPVFARGFSLITDTKLAWPLQERFLAVGAALMVVAPAWLRGGTCAGWTKYLPCLALLVGLMALGRAWAIRRRPLDHAAMVRKLLDPVVWLGLLFVLLLLLQWINSGRALYFDSGRGAWAYSPPQVDWLPSAITPAESRQMLDWFFPAWVLALILRSPLLSSRSVRQLWRWLSYQAGLLSLVGIVQYVLGTSSMFGLVPMTSHYFASFGYPNHAGSYFLLTMGLSAGLLSWELGAGKDDPRWGRRVAVGAVFLLGFVGANLSLSRFSIIMSWGLLFTASVLLVLFLWPRIAVVQRIHLIAVGLAAAALAMMLALGLGREGIRKEFESKPQHDYHTIVQRETSSRWFQLTSALAMWSDHPLYGVGGWGYRYLVGFYVPPEKWNRLNEGKGNAHNDPAQFLAEFGAVGAVCMAGVTLVLALAAWRARSGYPPLVVLPLMAVGLVGFQSLLDLPFRSPAVLILWLACLAGASRVLPQGKSVVSALVGR